MLSLVRLFFFFQAEDGIRDADVTGVQTCALPIFGSGAAEAGAEVLALAERLQAPVTTYTGGKGILSDRHYLAQNLLAGPELWRGADVVLAVGTRFNQPLTRWGLDRDIKVIRIDIDPIEINRVARPAIGIVAD